MNKVFLLLIFSLSIFSGKSQNLPENLENNLLKYFITLPQNKDFDKWIESIKKDPAITIDTAISRNENDSFYYYLSLDSKNFSSILAGNRKMIIVARNNVNWLPKDKIFLLVSMEYYLDTTTKSKSIVQEEYNHLSKELKDFFTTNYEKFGNKKNREFVSNSFYLDKTRFPTFLIQTGKYYKDRSYCLILSLNYQLEKK